MNSTSTKGFGKVIATLLITAALSVLMTATVLAAEYSFNSGNFTTVINVGKTLNSGDTITLVARDDGGLVPDDHIRITYKDADGNQIGYDDRNSPELAITQISTNIDTINSITVWTVTASELVDTHYHDFTLQPQTTQNDDKKDDEKKDPSTDPGRGTPYEGKPGETGKRYTEIIIGGDEDNPIVGYEVDGDLPPGLKIELSEDGKTLRLVGTPTKAGTYEFTVKVKFKNGDIVTVNRKIVIKAKSDDKGGEEPLPPAKTNPDAIVVNYYQNQADYVAHKRDPKAEFGKQVQGPACQAAFNASVPNGWYQAFTFSKSYDKKNTTTLKDGIIEVFVPHDHIKPGRSYGLMAMDQSGVVKIYTADTDNFPYVFTSPINVEGYAFALLTKD